MRSCAYARLDVYESESESERESVCVCVERTNDTRKKLVVDAHETTAHIGDGAVQREEPRCMQQQQSSLCATDMPRSTTWGATRAPVHGRTSMSQRT